MKNLSIFLISLFIVAGSIVAQVPPSKLLRVSPYASVSQTIGITEATISYHRPGVKGREIWNKLVPFGQVWRAGANNATSFEFSQDVTIAETTLKAGRYEFFLIPTENEWTIIFNSAKDQWGAYSYDSTLNVVTFKVKPETIPHEEWLSYSFSDLTSSSAKVSLKWDKTAISFIINTNTEENIKKSEASYSSLAAQQAAMFARYSLDTKTDVDNGVAAINRAIGMAPSLGYYSVKAQLLALQEKYADAVKSGEQGIDLGKKANANTSTLEKMVGEWKEKLPQTKGKKK